MNARRRNTRNAAQMTLSFEPTIPWKKETTQNKKKKASFLPEGDWRLLAIALILGIGGIIMIYNASGIRAEIVSAIGGKKGPQYTDSLYFVRRQLQWALMGVIAFVVASRIQLSRLREWIVPLTVLISSLLVAVLVVGPEIKGSQRWLVIGPFRIQPSEIAKLFVVIYLAHYIAKKGTQIRHFVHGTLPALIVIGIITFLVLVEPDFGASGVILMLSFPLLFLGGMPAWHLVGVVGIVSPFLYYWVMSAPYRVARIIAFFNPEKDPLGQGYQLNQSKIALGSGGVSGTGFVEGKQLRFFLPEPHTDFIFSVIGEAFGLLGTSLVLVLFALLLWKGTLIALKAEGTFEQILAFGMTLTITIPAFLNMGVVTGLLPTKGLSLPFVSYGGSSLLINCVAIGLLYNVSRRRLQNSTEETE